MSTAKARIWELDALRGICILGMVAVHLVYDLVELFRLVPWEYPQAFLLVKDYGGILFLLISGICVTLGTHSLRRGGIVFACGMVCTGVTWGMYALGFSEISIVIWFGVLHCLGACMLLWPVFRKLPAWALTLIGVVLVAAGFWARGITLQTPWLTPLGFPQRDFASGDYFPLLPNLGYFLLGAALGRTAYRNRTTLLPRVNPGNPCVRFFCLCGRQSLLIYLLHQPVLMGICALLTLGKL